MPRPLPSGRTRGHIPRGFMTIVAVVVLLLCAMTGLTALLVANSYQAGRLQAELQMRYITRNAADYVRRQLDVADVLADLTGAEIAEHLRAAILPSETLITALSRRVSELPQVSALHAYDQKGYLWLATGSDAMPLDVAGNDTFRRLRDGQRTALQIQGSPGQSALVRLARRMVLPDGSFAGVVVATIDLAAFDALDRRNLPVAVQALAVVHPGGPESEAPRGGKEGVTACRF